MVDFRDIHSYILQFKRGMILHDEEHSVDFKKYGRIFQYISPIRRKFRGSIPMNDKGYWIFNFQYFLLSCSSFDS